MAKTRILAASAIITGAVALFLVGMTNSSKLVGAQQGTSNQTDESRIRRGFEIAPVPLPKAPPHKRLRSCPAFDHNCRLDLAN